MTNLLLKFHASKEMLPENGQHIIYLRESSAYGYSGVQIAECVVSYLQSDGDGTFWDFDDPCDGELHVYIGDKDANFQK